MTCGKLLVEAVQAELPHSLLDIRNSLFTASSLQGSYKPEGF